MSYNYLLIFDLDGVLIESRQNHFKALNLAIEKVAGSKYVISEEDHLAIYDGLPTTKKLELLHENKSLDKAHFDDIWKEKQKFTVELILNETKKNQYLISICKYITDYIPNYNQLLFPNYNQLLFPNYNLIYISNS